MRVEARDRRGLRSLGARGLAAEVDFCFDLRKREWHGPGIAEFGQRVDPRTTGIAEAEQLRDLIEGFARGVVHGASHQRVIPCSLRRAGQIKVRVPAGDNKRESRISAGLQTGVPGESVFDSLGWETGCTGGVHAARSGLPLIQQHRVNVTFEMIHGNQRKMIRKSESLGVCNAHQKCTGKPGAGSHSDGIEIGERKVRLGQCGADHGNNGAEMLSAGQLRYHAAVSGVRSDLRSHHGGNGARATLHNRRSGFVAGAFNTENQARTGHNLSVLCSAGLPTGCSAGLLTRIRPRVVTKSRGQIATSRVSPIGLTIEIGAMANTLQFEAALQIVETLRAHKFEAYLAGGCVRDLLLGREPADYDVATNATPDVVLDMFPRTFAVGAHFGVVLVAPETEDAGFVTEVATFRSDLAYSDGRHPDAVRYTASAQEDVQRRDFTINGLLLDPMRGGSLLYECVRDPKLLRSAVIDCVGGLSDLDAGVVRAIGRPELRFAEDHLRMLRGVRFAARFGFELEPETQRAIRSLAPRIHAVSRERVRDELTKMLTEGHARRAFELLDETGLLAEVLPQIAR